MHYRGSVPNSTICSVQVDNPSRFGVLHLDKEKVVNFIEKPDDLKYGNNISMGFYYIVKEDILRIKESLPFIFIEFSFVTIFCICLKVSFYNIKLSIHSIDMICFSVSVNTCLQNKFLLIFLA